MSLSGNTETQNKASEVMYFVMLSSARDNNTFEFEKELERREKKLFTFSS